VLSDVSDGAWSAQVFSGGIAGDEKDVIRMVVTRHTPQYAKDEKKIYETVRKRLTGRVWPNSLFKRVMAVTGKNKG